MNLDLSCMKHWFITSTPITKWSEDVCVFEEAPEECVFSAAIYWFTPNIQYYTLITIVVSHVFEEK